ncbi:unnamed protein product [Psylliodes chrysocephalus]|uniref:PI-PLC X domain-containing protein 1-like n=2 Tax=Psylliodes chrysocephalus TaxID=3402493 RepID=A0A9P0CUZ8_9CUCU|nr:unnamed protein product [Psylliodes chrysocephala]
MSLVCASVFVVVFLIEGIWSHAGISQCGRVHLTVSSQDSYLEMNWITNCVNGEDIPEFIILSSKNVQDRDEDHEVLKMIKNSDYPSGYFKTKIKFGEPWLPGGWEYNDQTVKADPGPHCFPFWISSITKNFTIDSRCLSIQPTWMSDNRQYLGNQKIASLLIPGTHNSGSYKGVPGFLENYVLNQDRSIWTQLVFGIRYLDFRIGYYGREGFYINHDLIRVTKVRPLFQEIKKFLQLAPNEIVILDFHRFPYPTNFTLDLHRKFIEIVYEELGTFAVPSTDMRGGKGPSLNEIWAKNKNLIICYGNRGAVQDSYWLWNPIPQYWANTKSVSSLKQYIQKSIVEHSQASTINPLWALMAELTPQPLDVVFGTNNLRKLAQNVNSLLTQWFRDEWSTNTNVVATDFFLGNNMINVAIEINTRVKS